MEIKAYEDFKFEDENVGIDDVSIAYLQNSDCSGEDGEESVQSITISTRNNGCARFINIKTESWSISDIDELEKLINDFKNRAGLNEITKKADGVSKERDSFGKTTNSN